MSDESHVMCIESALANVGLYIHVSIIRQETNMYVRHSCVLVMQITLS